MTFAPPRYRAYLVAGLRPDGTYCVGIFSEPTPTIGMIGSNPSSVQAIAVIDQEEGRDYGEAARLLRQRAGNYYPWMVIPKRGGV